MLDDKKMVQQEENILKQPVKKKSYGWVFKLILLLVIIGVVLYLFANPSIVQEPVNDFFNGLLG